MMHKHIKNRHSFREQRLLFKKGGPNVPQVPGLPENGAEPPETQREKLKKTLREVADKMIQAGEGGRKYPVRTLFKAWIEHGDANVAKRAEAFGNMKATLTIALQWADELQENNTSENGDVSDEEQEALNALDQLTSFAEVRKLAEELGFVSAKNAPARKPAAAPRTPAERSATRVNKAHETVTARKAPDEQSQDLINTEIEKTLMELRRRKLTSDFTFEQQGNTIVATYEDAHGPETLTISLNVQKVRSLYGGGMSSKCIVTIKGKRYEYDKDLQPEGMIESIIDYVNEQDIRSGISTGRKNKEQSEKNREEKDQFDTAISELRTLWDVPEISISTTPTKDGGVDIKTTYLWSGHTEPTERTFHAKIDTNPYRASLMQIRDVANNSLSRVQSTALNGNDLVAAFKTTLLRDALKDIAKVKKEKEDTERTEAEDKERMASIRGVGEDLVASEYNAPRGRWKFNITQNPKVAHHYAYKAGDKQEAHYDNDVRLEATPDNKWSAYILHFKVDPKKNMYIVLEEGYARHGYTNKELLRGTFNGKTRSDIVAFAQKWLDGIDIGLREPTNEQKTSESDKQLNEYSKPAAENTLKYLASNEFKLKHPESHSHLTAKIRQRSRNERYNYDAESVVAISWDGKHSVDFYSGTGKWNKTKKTVNFIYRDQATIENGFKNRIDAYVTKFDENVKKLMPQAKEAKTMFEKNYGENYTFDIDPYGGREGPQIIITEKITNTKYTIDFCEADKSAAFNSGGSWSSSRRGNERFDYFAAKALHMLSNTEVRTTLTKMKEGMGTLKASHPELTFALNEKNPLEPILTVTNATGSVEHTFSQQYPYGNEQFVLVDQSNRRTFKKDSTYEECIESLLKKLNVK
jgi:hypothetical protein